MLSCPIPLDRYPRVLLAHGGGGRLMHQLIAQMILPAFSSSIETQHDAAILPAHNARTAFTTDTFVVSPLFFPGGDIGSLAVYGTANDLAMSGATPRYLSVSFILEEGLEMTTLWQIIQSIATAAKALDINIVTGDTKVVGRQQGDGIYINTSGIGTIEHALNIGPNAITEGDAVIVNGDLGRHGMAVVTSRQDLSFENNIESDCAPLCSLVNDLLTAELPIHCLRDITRGGLAAVLNELAESSSADIVIEDKHIPVIEPVAAVCEILGFDPINVACEGRMVLILPAQHVDKALATMRNNPLGSGATLIGHVSAGQGRAIRKNSLGISRPIEFHLGELLPRIC